MYLTKKDCVHLFMHIKCYNNPWMYKSLYYSTSSKIKFIYGQNGGPAIIWNYKLYTLITFLCLQIMQVCLIVWYSQVLTQTLIPFDLIQKQSKIADCSGNRTRSTDLLSSITRSLITISTWHFHQSFFIAKLRPVIYSSGPWIFFSNRSG